MKVVTVSSVMTVNAIISYEIITKIGPYPPISRQYFNMAPRLSGIDSFFSFLCHSIPKRDLDTKARKRSAGADWLIAAGAYPGSCRMKRLALFLLPLDGMLVHHRSLSRNL